MLGSKATLMAAVLLGLVALGGCQTTPHGMTDLGMRVEEGVTVLHGTKGNEDVRGTVRFIEMGNGQVKVIADVMGLDPGSTHAIHVHEYGDCTALDATSAGGHYNPEGHDHALPEETPTRHAGDLGNLEADDNGHARYTLVVDNISVAGAKNPVIGRAVIVHEGVDQGMAEQPTGAAGPRIACGVIGIVKPQ